ncbi:MAG: AAA family ATPase [Candidatus Omnitrophica bacterium]|nr:AAA family ATPase [Candidatus Omnitrophota bacterium]
MRIISITNQKGGCGKTTTAINLAAALSINNKKVLLIDLDPQSHGTLGLNIKADFSIYNVLSKLTPKKAKLQDIIQSVSENFDIAPSSIILSTLEQELAGEIGRESRLCETLSNFKANYDYVLIDCPPNLGILTINAIRASNEIIVPVEASRFSIEGLGQLIDIVSLVRERLEHDVSYKVLVTNFDSRLRHSFKLLDRIKTNFKGKLFDTIIHVNVKLKEAQNQGTHVFGFDKYCRGAKDYFSLARELVTREEKPIITSSEKWIVSKEQTTVSAEKLQEKMEEILKEKMPQLSEIVLSISAPQASQVHVTGDFNGWKISDDTRMEHVNGSWNKKLNLKGGKYRYRFVVDGQWIEDPNNLAKEMNPYGQMDSLLEIG